MSPVVGDCSLSVAHGNDLRCCLRNESFVDWLDLIVAIGGGDEPEIELAAAAAANVSAANFSNSLTLLLVKRELLSLSSESIRCGFCCCWVILVVVLEFSMWTCDADVAA